MLGRLDAAWACARLSALPRAWRSSKRIIDEELNWPCDSVNLSRNSADLLAVLVNCVGPLAIELPGDHRGGEVGNLLHSGAFDQQTDGLPGISAAHDGGHVLARPALPRG